MLQNAFRFRYLAFLFPEEKNSQKSHWVSLIGTISPNIQGWKTHTALNVTLTALHRILQHLKKSSKHLGHFWLCLEYFQCRKRNYSSWQKINLEASASIFVIVFCWSSAVLTRHLWMTGSREPHGLACYMSQDWLQCCCILMMFLVARGAVKLWQPELGLLSQGSPKTYIKTRKNIRHRSIG